MAIILSVLYFVISLGITIIAILISPLFLYRYIISLLCPFFRPDLEGIVNPRSAVHTIDDLHTDPKNSELLYVVVEGPIDLNELRSNFLKRFDEFCLVAFKQYFVKWMGYYFWKRDLKFDVKNHIEYYVGKNGNIDEPFTEEQIVSQHNDFLKRPFPRFRSSWHLSLVKNYHPKDAEPGKQYSLFIYLIHHSLADGYGLMSAFFDLETLDLPKENMASKLKGNYILKLFSNVLFVVRAPYTFVKYYHECMDTNSPFIMKNRSGNYHAGFAKLRLPLVKKVKQKYGASFTSVYLSAITAGIRNYLLDNNLHIPSVIHVFMPLPLPGPIEPLTNRITFILLKLPVGTEDSEKRLRFMMEQFTQLKNSDFPLILSFIPLITGSLPSFIMRPLITVKYTSAVTSNFPGPRVDTKFFDYSLVDWSVSGNLMGHHTGMAFANISYKNSSNVILIGDKSIFPEEKSVEKIMETLNNEIEFLSQ